MKWDKLRRARWLLGEKRNICESPKAFKIICDEIRELKNEIKKINKKAKNG